MGEREKYMFPVTVLLSRAEGTVDGGKISCVSVRSSEISSGTCSQLYRFYFHDLLVQLRP